MGFNRKSFIAASVVASGLVASAAQAVPFVDINFDGDTIGANPTVAPSPAPATMVKPSALGGNTVLIPDGPLDPSMGTTLVGNVGPLSKAAVLTNNPLNGEQGALWVDVNGINYASQQMLLSFDLNIIDAPIAPLSQIKTVDGGPATAGMIFGANTFSGTGGNLARFAAAATTANGGVFAIRSENGNDLQTFFTYTENQTYNIKLFSDYDTGTVSTFVDGAFKGDFAFAASGAPGTSTGELFFFLNGDVGSSSSIAIDNIVAVPEPASLGLLALGGIAAVGRRRRAVAH